MTWTYNLWKTYNLCHASYEPSKKSGCGETFYNIMKYLWLMCYLGTKPHGISFTRKRWHLFPPDDTPCLYPTRIPYEESSVFSQVSVVHPDLKKFPEFRRAQVHTVTLQPGQVSLYEFFLIHFLSKFWTHQVILYYYELHFRIVQNNINVKYLMHPMMTS